jgi:N-acyl-phosphatidylethanolamine-hydrolysing phospholipase D
MPQKTRCYLKRTIQDLVVEHTWWQKYTMLNQSITCTFLPASHWSQRGFFDKNKSLWGGWMIMSKDYCIYFAGDTAYDDHFVNIAQQFTDIDIALLPIGPCEPRKWIQHSHMNALEAGQAFIDLKARHFIPMHWGTFYFGVDAFDAPMQQLKQWVNANHAAYNVHILKIGESYQITK